MGRRDSARIRGIGLLRAAAQQQTRRQKGGSGCHQGLQSGVHGKNIATFLPARKSVQDYAGGGLESFRLKRSAIQST